MAAAAPYAGVQAGLSSNMVNSAKILRRTSCRTVNSCLGTQARPACIIAIYRKRPCIGWCVKCEPFGYVKCYSHCVLPIGIRIIPELLPGLTGTASSGGSCAAHGDCHGGRQKSVCTLSRCADKMLKHPLSNLGYSPWHSIRGCWPWTRRESREVPFKV